MFDENVPKTFAVQEQNIIFASASAVTALRRPYDRYRRLNDRPRATPHHGNNIIGASRMGQLW